MPTRLPYRNAADLRRLLLDRDPAEQVAQMSDLELQLHPAFGPETPFLRIDGQRIFAVRDRDTDLPRATVADLLEILPA